MSQTARPYTVATVKNMAAGLAHEARAVLMATAHAQLERERMNALDRELIAFWKPVDRHTGAPITKPEHTWRMGESFWKDYHADRQARIDAMGYKLPRDHCPALVAEGVQRRAERLLLTSAARWIGHLHPDGLYSCELHKRALKLVLGLVVNHPGFEAPKLKIA